MEHGHDDFGCRAPFAFVVVDRNTAAIVSNRNTLVAMNDDLDLIAVPGESLVNRVIHDLKDHMV